MSELHKDHIGATWLAHTFEVFPITPLLVESQIGGRRHSKITEFKWVETYPAIMRPASDPASHLLFHLRHEVINLEFLARLFRKAGPTFVQEWINAEPTGKYARIVAFLYEWLTGDTLIVPERLNGNYVYVIDSDKLLAASPGCVEKVRRWRVINNLPGTPDFCPMVFKSETVLQAMNLNISDLLSELVSEFGQIHFFRLSKYIANSESISSFVLEGENNQLNRSQRFVNATSRRTAKGKVPLDELALAQLQKEIIGDKTNLIRMGLRQSPAFVASTIGNQEIVHYVAPPAKCVSAMLEGLRIFLERTQGQSSLMRSAIVSFGLIYIHPLADGNGRVHRFLINDILRRDGVIPESMILPISAAIASTPGELFNYQRVLDVVSQPLMRRVREFVAFKSIETKYPDGVVSSLDFTAEDEAIYTWRYPNLSQHIVYLSNLIYLTLTQEMRVQVRYLRRNDRMLAALKEIVEMPDPQANRILRSIEQNNGVLSNVLAKDMPILEEPGIWQEIKEVVTLVAAEEDALMAQDMVRRYRST